MDPRDDKSTTRRDRGPDAAAVVYYLSGPHRGQAQKLSGSTLHLELHAAGHTSLQAVDAAGEGNLLGALHRSGDSYELAMEPGCQAWVNGEAATTRLLQSGDLVEVDGGPVLRFRILARGAQPLDTAADVFADRAQAGTPTGPSRQARFPPAWLGQLYRRLLRSRLLFRGGVVAALAALALVVVLQQQETRQIALELEREQAWVQVLAESLRQGERDKLTRDDFALVRARIEQGLAHTGERVAALETRSAAFQTIIAQFAHSVVFVQGRYGFVQEKTGRPLRVVLGPDGNPLVLPGGRAAMSLTGEGPPVERVFTGTAFIASPEGLLLTNRHVVMPWESLDTGQAAKAIGLEPALHSMVGFLPGRAEPVDVELIVASDHEDIALLRSRSATPLPTALRRASGTPRVGDEVIVLGYPTGVRALLARSGTRFVEALSRREELDMLGVTQELAKAGLVTPLASRGIIAQVTADAIVYDAQTTQGGSGGPVVNLDGEVVAINAAILPGFGGSNIGVPIAHAERLMATRRAGK